MRHVQGPKRDSLLCKGKLISSITFYIIEKSFYVFIPLCRFDEKYYDRAILKKCYEHNRTETCDVCKKEENKSRSSPKYQGRTILDLMILPKRECWVCETTFETNHDQNEHFRIQHDYGSLFGSFR